MNAFGVAATWLLLVAVLAGCASSEITQRLPAKAQEQQSLAKFIDHYSGIQVRIEGQSAKCDVRDGDLYAKKLGERLRAIGITPNPIAVTRAYLFIWAIRFGPLNQQCATFMSLRLGTDVSLAVARIDAKIKGDKVLMARIKALKGTVPAAFYIVAKMFVKVRRNTPEHVLTVIEQLVEEVDKVRKS